MKHFKIYVNDDQIKKKLDGFNFDFINLPSDINDGSLAAVVLFLEPSGERDYTDVFMVLQTIKDKDTPVIVLDEKLFPEHSKRVWLHKNTVRYLPLDDPGTTWLEVKRYLTRRIEHHKIAKTFKTDEVYKVGWSVNISPEDFKAYNLVSLFIGSMGDFMVELKQLLENIQPAELENNPLKDMEFPKILEYEWAVRNNMKQHEYKGKTVSNEEMKTYLGDTGARSLFDRSPPALTRNHIIIEGETGTGKSIIADFIHAYVYQYFHPSKRGDLKRVSCANLGEKIMETQLFGSIQGAYTDAITRPGAIMEAYNGTVFLDEIGELTPELQARVLYYLETQTVQPEGWSKEPIYVPSLIVAATNRKLQDEVERGNFRRDLHHRLGFTVTIPPLRDRIGDLQCLVDFVLQNPVINPRKKRGAPAVAHIDRKAIDLLKSYDFPGNFRELEQLLRQAVIRTQRHGVRVITAETIGNFLSQK